MPVKPRRRHQHGHGDRPEPPSQGHMGTPAPSRGSPCSELRGAVMKTECQTCSVTERPRAMRHSGAEGLWMPR